MLSAFSGTLHCLFPYLRGTVKFVAYIIISLTDKVLLILRNTWPPFFRVMHKTLSLSSNWSLVLCTLKEKPQYDLTVILLQSCTNVNWMYRRPCLWSYENIVSSCVAPAGLGFKQWELRVASWSNFEWNDQSRDYFLVNFWIIVHVA